MKKKPQTLIIFKPVHVTLAKKDLLYKVLMPDSWENAMKWKHSLQLCSVCRLKSTRRHAVVPLFRNSWQQCQNTMYLKKFTVMLNKILFYSYSMWAIMWMFLKFIGVYNVASTSLELMIVIVIKDVLLCLNMKINNHNQQSYCGTSKRPGLLSDTITWTYLWAAYCPSACFERGFFIIRKIWKAVLPQEILLKPFRGSLSSQDWIFQQYKKIIVHISLFDQIKSESLLLAINYLGAWGFKKFQNNWNGEKKKLS